MSSGKNKSVSGITSPAKKQKQSDEEKKEIDIPKDFSFIDESLKDLSELFMVWEDAESPVCIIRREDLPITIRIKTSKVTRSRPYSRSSKIVSREVLDVSDGVTIYECLEATKDMWKKKLSGKLEFDASTQDLDYYMKWAMVRAYGAVNGWYDLGANLKEEKVIQVFKNGEWIDNDTEDRFPGIFLVRECEQDE